MLVTQWSPISVPSPPPDNPFRDLPPAPLPSVARIGQVASLAILAPVVAYVAWFHALPIGGPEEWAAFGTYVAGISGPLLSALAVLIVAKTLSVQYDQLRLTLAEVKDTQIRQAEQARTAQQRAFEARFFEQLHHFTRVVRAARAEELVIDANLRYQCLLQYAEAVHQELEGVYDDRYQQNVSTLGPYFRLLYHLLKTIDRADALDEADKRSYASLVRAHLGADDLLLVLLNVMFNQEGREGLRPFVEKYGLLKHLKNLKHPKILADAVKQADLAECAFQSWEEMRSQRTAGHA